MLSNQFHLDLSAQTTFCRIWSSRGCTAQLLLFLPQITSFQSSSCDYSQWPGWAWPFSSFRAKPRDVQERMQDSGKFGLGQTHLLLKSTRYLESHTAKDCGDCIAHSSPQTAGWERRHKMLRHQFAKHSSKHCAVLHFSFLLNILSLWHPATFVIMDYNFSLMENFGQTVLSHGRE